MMLDTTANMYRVLAAVVVVLLFFVTGRPYFTSRIRVFVAAVTAGILNGIGGAALMGTSLSGVPLRFVIAFVAVGAGVAALEYLVPEGHRYRRLGQRG